MHLLVKDLIEILNKKDQEAPVYVSGESCIYAATDVCDRTESTGVIIESDEI